MISIVICNRDNQELVSMHECSRFLAGRLCDEEWKFNLIKNTEELEEFVREDQVFDIVCADLEIKDSIPLIKQLRKKNEHAYIILVATPQISPMMYMKPDIMAGSLLIRKYSNEQMKEVFKEAFSYYLDDFSSEDGKEDMYIVESREGRRLIPFSQIYYFEASSKKIVVGCANSEVSCYDTMASIEEMLPDNFIRCHRSYIINLNKVVKVVFSQNEIELENDIWIPISRSCKARLKEVFSDRKKNNTEEG